VSGDTVHAQHAIADRMRGLDEKVSRLTTLRGQLQENLEETKAEVEHLSSEIDVLTKVEELFRVLMDALVVNQVKTIEKVVTEGFQTIFFDQDLYFESEVGPKYNKMSIDFFIRQVRNGVTVRGKPLDSFGGGPSSIASLILRVISLFRLQRFPLLLLDETLNAVSDHYIENTGSFLQTLSSEMGVPILLITHKTGYLDHSDLAYQAVEKVENDCCSLQLKVKS